MSALLLLLLIFPLVAPCAEQTESPIQQPSPPDLQSPSSDDQQQLLPQYLQPERLIELPVALLNSADAPRDYLSGEIVDFAKNLDRFFGDERDYQERNQSVVQLAIDKMSGYGGDRKPVFSVRANLNLPSTEKRFHLMLESDPDQNIASEPSQSQNVPIANQVNAPKSYGLALRYEKMKEELIVSHLSADAGVKFQGLRIDPFVRARGSYSIPMDQWRFKAAQSVYWFNTTGLGETTQVDLEHFLSKPVLFRATSNLTWFKDKQSFDARQDLSFYHTLNERNALLYQASTIGVSNPQWQVSDYVLLAQYRYRLHRKWIFFEVSPQLHFPKERNYQSSPAINFRLEMLFDEPE